MGSVCHEDLGICAFYDICNCFGVVVYIDLLSIGGGRMGSVYTGICAFCYM